MRYLLILICCLIPIALCAATITEWYCPKCGSMDISESIKPEPNNAQRKSMDEFKGSMVTAMTLEYRAKTYILKCNKCGYKVEVTQ